MNTISHQPLCCSKSPQHSSRKQLWSRTLSSRHAERETVANEADVIVVGAGIVGVSICRQILRQSKGSCSVQLIDSHLAGHATGAGQGYIWMAHRQIGTPAWMLAQWSCKQWRESLTPELSAAVEWQETGSLLLADDAAEGEQLQDRATQLRNEGLAAEVLSSQALREAEPALRVSDGMSGLLLQTDAQINGRKAAAYLLEECQKFGSNFAMRSGDVCDLQLGSDGSATGIILEDGTRVKSHKGVVMTAGAWTGRLLTAALGDQSWEDTLKPRKGHLLELEWPKSVPALKRGLMEIGYAKHYKIAGEEAQSRAELEDDIAVTFTATMSAYGSLLLGSSREFSGFSSSPSMAVQHAILARARTYLPALDNLQSPNTQVRVGLRPFSRKGPIIGPVTGCDNLYIAGGHEGSGLTLAPATACIIASMILSEPVPDWAYSLSPRAVMAT